MPGFCEYREECPYTLYHRNHLLTCKGIDGCSMYTALKFRHSWEEKYEREAQPATSNYLSCLAMRAICGKKEKKDEET